MATRLARRKRANIESAINGLKEAVKGDSADAIKRAMDNLNTASQEIGKKMYENVAGAQGAAPGAAGPQGAPPSGGEKPKGGDDVIDAEYEVKKDK